MIPKVFTVYIKYTKQVGATHEARFPCVEEGWEPALEVAKEEATKAKGCSKASPSMRLFSFHFQHRRLPGDKVIDPDI
jgi:hypothetical protein